MTPFVPAHRRKRDPWRRAQLAPQKLAPKADCECGEKWAGHAPGDGDERGYCLKPNCPCRRYRPGGVRRG